MAKVKICKACGGEGKTLVKEPVHAGNCTVTDCPECMGSGKLYVRKFKVTIPFDSKMSPAYLEAERNVLSEINKLHICISYYENNGVQGA